MMKSGPTRVSSRAQIRPQALFSSFKLIGRGQTQASSRAKKERLLDSLLRLTQDCDAGFRTRPAERDEISSLVEELSAYCPSNPLNRPELLGRWEVRYASKPTTAGGPFKTLPGRVIFPGQVAVQGIEEPDVIINEISFKTLGFIPGSVTQRGTITPISGSAFEIEFPNSTKKVGGPQKRTIELLYLDDNIRVARAIPRDEGQDGSFYVFQREGVEFEFDDEEDVRGQTATLPIQSAEEARAKRAAAAEEAKLERARAAEERAAATAQAKMEREAAAEQARAEREALAARKAAAKDLYADLSSESRELSLAAQATAKELAVLEREAAKTIRDASIARRSIEKAEEIVTSLLGKLDKSKADELAIEEELRARQLELGQVRVALSKTRKALSPK